MPLTNKQKAILTETYFNLYATNEIIEVRLEWNDLQYFEHPQLDEKLIPYLENKDNLLQVRELAMDLIVACNIDTLNDYLISIALDKEENSQLRLRALVILSHQDEHIKNSVELIPLALNPQKLNADEYIQAYTIDILYPNNITSQQVFNIISASRIDIHSIDRAFDRIYSEKFVNRIPKNDLPIALDWIVKQEVRDNEVSFLARNFILDIMNRAWKYLHNPEVLTAFAKTAWHRLFNYNPVLNLATKTNESNPDTFKYTIDKYKLVEIMLDILTPESLQNIRLQEFLIYRFPIVTIDDVDWLIEKLRETNIDDKKIAYCNLLEEFAQPQNVQQVALIHQEYETYQNRILFDKFHHKFEAIPLDSSEAKNAKEYHKKRLDFQKSMKEQEGGKYPLEAKIDEWIEKCTQDSANWWILNLNILANEYGYCLENEIDLTKGYGWQFIKVDEEKLKSIIQFALRYINEQNPYIENYDKANPLEYHRPALAGYRALILLGKFDYVDNLDEQDWVKWSEITVFNSIQFGYSQSSNEVQQIEELLLQKVFSYELSTNIILNKLEAMLKEGKTNYTISNILNRFKDIKSEKFVQILIDYFKNITPENSNYGYILDTLLQSTHSISSQAQKHALDQFQKHSDTEKNREMIRQIIIPVTNHAKNGRWLDDIWQIIEEDIDFAELVLNSMADDIYIPYFEFLSEKQLQKLYFLAVKVYRYTDDIIFHSGAVPARYIFQRWRDKILGEIASRGTQESVEFMYLIKEQIPEATGINSLIEFTLRIYNQKSLVAPKPQYILEYFNVPSTT